MQYTVVTTPYTDGHIEQVLFLEDVGDIRQEIFRRVLHTSEQQIREALIQLGWTPPAQP